MRCLGTMLKCQARGDTLAFVTVTDGSLGFVQRPEISRVEAAAIRHAEMTALAGAIAAEYLNLRQQDEFLYDTPEVRLKLIEAIRKLRADLIFTHYGEDYNLDHTTVNALVRQCAMHACLPVIRTESEPLRQSPAVFLVEPHGPFPFPATHYVDISDFFERKAELLRCHRSQEEAFQKAFNTGLREVCAKLDVYRGDLAGCRYAECLCPCRPAVR